METRSARPLRFLCVVAALLWLGAEANAGTFYAASNGVDNGACGNSLIPCRSLLATNNFWGAGTGPGKPPADRFCNVEGTTTTSPFATSRFAINPSFDP